MRIGIDLGGTKIEAAIVDGGGRTRVRRRLATPHGDYAATVAAVARLVRTVAAEADLSPRAPVGVGIPGAISPATGLVKNANSTWLIGRPLFEDLSRALGRPLRMANDANCFAVSEALDGAAAGAEVVFGVILGTGVGGGLVVGGRPLSGRNAIAGEWGHNPLPWPEDAERPGPACYCGRRGCIETFLSGPGLARDHALHEGDAVDAATLAARAATGEPAAAATLARHAGRLARALASVINVVDPDVIVLGGGVSNIDALYGRVPALWGEWVFSDRVDTPLRRHVHGDSSGVRGAAMLWSAAEAHQAAGR